MFKASATTKSAQQNGELAYGVAVAAGRGNLPEVGVELAVAPVKERGVGPEGVGGGEGH